MHSTDDYYKVTKAIEFFSQNLHEEQFARYGYPFLHDLLDLEKSALFMLKNFKNEQSPYVLTHRIKTDLDVKVIKNSKILKNLAILHGRYLTHNFDHYFNENLLNDTSINLVIPIINESVLYGFIISIDDMPYSGNLGHLQIVNIIMNMSFSHIIDQKILKERSSLLRSEVYNLNMLTHLIAEIVAEKDLNKLYDLCIDSIRELTASAYTTVVFYDEIAEKFVTKVSKDIVEQNNLVLSYELKEDRTNNFKNIYNVEKDFELLDKIFVNAENFNRINAKYVLMMSDKDLKGFITISKPVNEKEIDESLLYKINTIAHFILIAVKNASYIEEIEKQNAIIESQMITLKNLNDSISIINACESLDELIDVLITTLEVQFDIEKCFFINRWDQENELVTNRDDYVNLKVNVDKLPVKFDYDYDSSSIKKILNVESEEHNCLIVAPIKIMTLDREEIIGHLIITQVKERLEEHQLTAIKTISQLISPVIKSFLKVKTIEEHYLVDEEAIFLKKVEEAIDAKKAYHLDFFILYKKINQKPFQMNSKKISECYTFKNHSFKIIHDKKNIDASWHLLEINSIEELIHYFSE